MPDQGSATVSMLARKGFGQFRSLKLTGVWVHHGCTTCSGVFIHLRKSKVPKNNFDLKNFNALFMAEISAVIVLRPLASEPPPPGGVPTGLW